ncbi:PTS lactose/cellobiose transporter subunit IIA [Listeria seeligeri]|uniref:PTS lactose/cellobiose transporter subunit IIA n=1 Tax=Listeria seeligeri TaxID=1640 RepID=UPI00162A5F74|nr:PTS lactose/cellobiose transporter subunit IIA [Listeria seeligeri]MBC1480327.1 PTS lactose/cellobiose transporter subunit IIA [Listeria seeligeri]MBC1721556.1 PTS lactose/cellobiose transporter subunit IIA [Listeria seeligeri]MBC1728467.1 PTS lactose/cellobiose transporter subunit IIA [Listeria seeligeri]MBC1745476.1 PTS lactose/cellobiose transporter subunit IIA [Listeria seeligeri]MBC1791335.1 PTS lactose/cellobiose transporter subunit IIA [Listeria seeligeri]
MEGVELISFQIISSVGTARSCYIEAIQLAKENNTKEAYNKLKEGETYFNEGHHAHSQLIQQEAAGGRIEFSIILMHAEDQLMSAEAFRIIAEEFIEVYKKMK